MDFSLLAEDVVQAVQALRCSGHVDPDRVGLAGYSQGGWVAPLAASGTHVAFLLAAYGMIDSPAAEDRAETLQALRRRGFGEEQLARADEVISAVHRIIASAFREGWSELGSLKRRYRAEPWLREMGGFSDPFIRYPRWLLRTFGKRRFPPGLPLHHHSADILGQLDVPVLWLVAGADREAPPAATIAWLEQNGRPNISWKVYPDADHGMLEFVEHQGELCRNTWVPAMPTLTAASIEAKLREAAPAGVAAWRALRRGWSRELRSEPGARVVQIARHLDTDVPWSRLTAYELIASHPSAVRALTTTDVLALSRGLADWGSVDAFACYVAGPAWREGRLPMRQIQDWLRSSDRWLRRTAVVCTVALNVRARGGRGDVTRTLAVCRRVAADRDDMVVKALSWALRSLIEWDAGAVAAFLEEHEAELAPRVTREVRTKLRTGRKR